MGSQLNHKLLPSDINREPIANIPYIAKQALPSVKGCTMNNNPTHTFFDFWPIQYCLGKAINEDIQ